MIKTNSKEQGIVELSYADAQTLLTNNEWQGRFYYKKDENTYIGIDNSKGELWVNDFESEEECFKWLLDKNK